LFNKFPNAHKSSECWRDCTTVLPHWQANVAEEVTFWECRQMTVSIAAAVCQFCWVGASSAGIGTRPHTGLLINTTLHLIRFVALTRRRYKYSSIPGRRNACLCLETQITRQGLFIPVS
jgi:hypothetical protein